MPLDGPRSKAELDAVAGDTITADGIGGLAALELFDEQLAPACISTDHPRYLSFIPCAPTEASALFDLVVGASSIYGGSWLEGAGAVYAENAALRWVADLVGLPPSGRRGLRARRHDRQPVGAGGRPARGAGGTPRPAAAAPGPLEGRRHRRRRTPRSRRACDVMDVDFVGVAGRRRAAADRRRTLRAAARGRRRRRPSSPSSRPRGTTNFGIVDDLASVAEVCREFGVWFHVDGAYGGAGLAAP